MDPRAGGDGVLAAPAGCGDSDDDGDSTRRARRQSSASRRRAAARERGRHPRRRAGRERRPAASGAGQRGGPDRHGRGEEDHAAGSVERPRAVGVREGRRRLRRRASRGRGRARRRRQRRQDPAGACAPATRPTSWPRSTRPTSASSAQSGGWIDLTDNLAADGIDVNIFPATTRYYTSYDGKQCALPILADAYGLYYNKALLAKAGLTEPPKTVDELMDYAKKLTVKNADGSLEVVGFDPFVRLLPEHRAVVGAALGRQVDRRPGQVDPGQRPGLDRDADLAEGARRLLRLRQPGQVAGRRRRRVLARRTRSRPASSR